MVEQDRVKLNEARVVAFVHAKGTSERLPGKNLRILGDRPLICHAIRNALAAEEIDAVVIDSDYDEILRVGEEAGAIPLKRPEELASNSTTGDDLAYWQASNVPQAEIIVQAVPTSPFVSCLAMDIAIRMLQNHRLIDTVVGVRSEALYWWVNGEPRYLRPNGSIPNSQDLPHTVYETSGLYVIRRGYAYAFKRRLHPTSCLPFELSRLEAIDINTEEDFAFAEVVWKGLTS